MIKIRRTLDEAVKTLETGRERIGVHKETAAEMKWADDLRTTSRREKETQLADVNARLEEAKNKYYGMVDGEDGAMYELAVDYQKQLNQILETEARGVWNGGFNDGSAKKAALLERYGESVAEYADALDAARKQIDDLASKQATLQNLLDKDIQAEERAKAVKEQAEKQRRLAAEQSEKITDSSRSFLRDFAVRKRNNDIQDRISDLQDSGTAGIPAVREFANLLDAQREAKYLLETDAIKNAEKAQDESLGLEERAGLMELAAKQRNEAATYDGAIDLLKNAVAGVRTEWNPDMAAVTSLASMGFGAGEKNDNLVRQQQYWTETTNLQREIRNILNDRSFEATYE